MHEARSTQYFCGKQRVTPQNERGRKKEARRWYLGIVPPKVSQAHSLQPLAILLRAENDDLVVAVEIEHVEHAGSDDQGSNSESHHDMPAEAPLDRDQGSIQGSHIFLVWNSRVRVPQRLDDHAFRAQVLLPHSQIDIHE